MYGFGNEFKGLIIFVVGIVLLIAGLVVVAQHVSLPGSRAEIEQLRSDAANVSPATAEDVIGQVTAWNQTIVSYQRYNQIWWSSWAIPDGWDDIKVISVPVVTSP